MGENTSKNRKRYNHLLGEIEGTYHDLSVKLGISDSVSRILYTICCAGDSCLLHAVCRHTGLSKQTVNSAIRKLEREGIVYLEAVDGKAKKVCLTEEGKLFADQTARRVITMENDIFASWPRDDVEKYLELTERFLISMKEKVKPL